MKKSILVILALMLVAVFALCGCGKETSETSKEKEAETKTVATTAPAVTLDEEGAKAMVFADLNIQESAAENLTVTQEGTSYVISFEWSGFDYQYTIDAVNGDITEILFDGEPLW